MYVILAELFSTISVTELGAVTVVRSVERANERLPSVRAKSLVLDTSCFLRNRLTSHIAMKSLCSSAKVLLLMCVEITFGQQRVTFVHYLFQLPLALLLIAHPPWQVREEPHVHGFRTAPRDQHHRLQLRGVVHR